MGGQLFNADAQAGGCTAKALRAKAGCIDGIQQLFFQRGIIGVRVGLVQRAQSVPFWPELRSLSKLPPIPMPMHNGGQGLAPACLTVSITKSFYARTPFGQG